MIHDIDLIQYLVDAPLETVDAVGVPVLSERDDIANARLRFEGGCVANVTASRAGLKRERKMRLFQRDAYISIDFHASSAVIARRSADEMYPGTPKIDLDQRQFKANDPLAREIDAFIDAVRGRRPVEVSGLDGLRALETAIEITRAMERPDDI
jgi:predicted dehydrogenase